MLSGPVANKIYCPHEYPSSLLDLKIKFECRRIASYIRGQNKRLNNSLRTCHCCIVQQGVQNPV